MGQPNKQKIIEDILRLQQDFQALTQRSNGLQHENEYFQAQLQSLQNQLQAKRQRQNNQQLISQNQQNSQPSWPLYLKIQGDTLPQQPGEFIKFQGQDGKFYVQNLQLVQYTETLPDGKGQNIVRQQYMVVQQPLQLFEQTHGPFDQLGIRKDQKSNNQQTNEHQTQNVQKNIENAK